MNPLWLLPSVVVIIIATVWLGGKVSPRLDRTLNRLGRVIFGRFISPNTTREMRIEAAYIGTTYRTYAAKTLLFVVLGFVAGAIAGTYLIAGFLAVLEPIVRALSGLPRTMTRPLGIHPEFTFEIATTTYWLVLVVRRHCAGNTNSRPRLRFPLATTRKRCCGQRTGNQ